MTVLALQLVVAAAASWAITGLALRYALARGVLDRPNERSLHVRPTPRGGGIGIVIVVLAFVAGAGILGHLEGRIALGVLGAGALVAAAGWVDDHVGVSRGGRLLMHALAAVWVVACLGGMTELEVGATRLALGHAGSVGAVLLIAWLINLYNFMDGADGVAAGQAVVAGGIGGAFLLSGAGRHPGLGWLSLVAAAAAFGFLLWNWQPARIFMGDTASGFLGLLFGAIMVASEVRGAVPLLVWLMLLGAFLFDATVTLVRRILRGERWREAHRRHAYQRVIQAGASHAATASGIVALGVVAGALAWWSIDDAESGPVAFALFYGLLALLYLLIERLAPWRVGASAPVADRPAPPA